MGVLDRFEKRLDRLVNGAFARTFKSEVEPVEVAAALQRECDDRAAIVDRTRRVVPNVFTVELGEHDYERLEASFNELAAHAPASFERWEGLAKSGAQAAARRDEVLVRQSCQDCHDSYRADFRRRLRSVDLL